MTNRPKLVGVHWTTVEDAILVDDWPDPNTDFAAIAKRLPTPRSVDAIKHRGYKIGLGRKARPGSILTTVNGLSPWPSDMPKFEDHPDAVPTGSRAKAVRMGEYFLSAGAELASSPTGSTLDGAAIFPRGRRV